jgi:hypothetical protein
MLCMVRGLSVRRQKCLCLSVDDDPLLEAKDMAGASTPVHVDGRGKDKRSTMTMAVGGGER